jgi:Sap, sulfolipid-1-addressing protein
VSWSQVLIGALFVLLAVRTWSRRAPTGQPAVFVVVASLTIAVPVVYHLVGGVAARIRLDAVKEWLGLHNDAVMTVLFLVLGVNLVSKGVPPLT